MVTPKLSIYLIDFFIYLTLQHLTPSLTLLVVNFISFIFLAALNMFLINRARSFLFFVASGVKKESPTFIFLKGYFCRVFISGAGIFLSILNIFYLLNNEDRLNSSQIESSFPGVILVIPHILCFAMESSSFSLTPAQTKQLSAPLRMFFILRKLYFFLLVGFVILTASSQHHIHCPRFPLSANRRTCEQSNQVDPPL